MDKILLIIQREYLVRVKKKSFIVLTILVPVLFIALIAAVGYIAVKGSDLGDAKKVLVIDETGTFNNQLKDSKSIFYTYKQEDYATAKTRFIADGYSYLLHIPTGNGGNIELLSDKNPSAVTIDAVETALSRVAEARRLQAAGIDTAVLSQAQKKIEIKAKQLTDTGEKDAQTYTAYAIGLLSAFLIYLSLVLYGTQVMRSVIEEKVSRIIEIIISSVKPLQLMLGKIIGVGLVGLTQFFLWIALTAVLSTAAGSLLAGASANKDQQMQQVQAMVGKEEMKRVAQPDGAAQTIMASIDSIPVAYTLSCFIFYFLFGYLIYSALFAAVGSAVDNETETQQFIFPITLPLIFTFALSQSFIINNPDSPMSVWLSIIPFTSPIAMMIRIPFGVPVWQLATSMVLLVLGFLLTAWVAARIYRVGILMYGKRVSYKELVKWFLYKE